MALRLKKVLTLIFGLFVVIEILYVTVANVMLNTSILPAILNRHPERLRIEYAHAWTLWPALVNVRQLTVRVQGPKQQVWVGLDSGRGSIDLPALLRREFHTTSIVGEGVVYHMRRLPVSPELASSHHIAPVPGLEYPPDKLLEPKDPPWTSRLVNIDVDHVRDVWVENVRFQGEARVTGAITIKPRESIQADASAVQIRSGGMTLEGKAMATGLEGWIHLHLDPFVPGKTKGLDLLESFTLGVTVKGQVPDIKFLNYLLRKAPWVRLHGPGALDTDVRLVKGDLAVGSRIDVICDPARVDILEAAAKGRAEVHLEVDTDDGRPISRLVAKFKDFTVFNADQVFVHGEGLKLTATSRDLTVKDPFATLNLRLELPEADVPDLSVYNASLPDQAALRIVKGAGRIEGYLEAATDRPGGEGALKLHGKGVTLRLNGTQLSGDLGVEVKLQDAKLEAGEYDIKGSHLALENVKVADAGSSEAPRQDGWWARLEVGQGWIHTGKDVYFQADVQARMRDSGPLLAIFAASKGLPKWTADVVKIDNLKAHGRIRLGKKVVSIPELKVDGKGADLEARLRFTGKEKEGAMYLELGPLSAAVALRDDYTRVQLANARAWYERQPPGATTGGLYRIDPLHPGLIPFP